MLSQYCERIREKYGITIGQVRKLISTLKDKNNYVLHYRSVHLHLDLDLKINKRFMELWSFINHLGSKSILISILTLFKLTNNKVFDRIKGNVRKRVDVRLVTNEKKACGKPNFVSVKIFNENLVAVHNTKSYSFQGQHMWGCAFLIYQRLSCTFSTTIILKTNMEIKPDYYSPTQTV